MQKIKATWHNFHRIEQYVLLACAVALAFFAALNLSRWRQASAPSPLLTEVPQTAPSPALNAASANSTGAAEMTAITIQVHVAGAVNRPGLHELPAESRVVEAIRRAGGPTAEADLNALNMAARVEDGQKIVVARRQQAGAAAASTSSSVTAGAPGPVNINTASAAELEALPGVGPTIAARILKHRTEQGPFSSLSDLDGVPGIGPKKLDEIKDDITF